MTQTNDGSFQSELNGLTTPELPIDEDLDDEFRTNQPRLSRTRRRRIQYAQRPFFATVDTYHSINGSLLGSNTTDYAPRTAAYELTSDTIHNPNYDETKFGPPSDDGGPMIHYRIDWYDDRPFSYDFRRPSYKHYYGLASLVANGAAHAGITVSTSDRPPLEDLSATQYGPLLWRLMKPAKPTLGFGQFAVELRDIPRLLQARVEGIKTITDLVLAVKFGWEPILRDIMNMLNFYERFSRQVEFILKNIGKPLWRSAQLTPVSFVGEVDSAIGTNTQWIAPNIGNIYFGGPDSSRNSNVLDLTMTRKIWGSGVFVFYFNKGRVPDRRELIAKLAGLEITPSLVWEVLPWSWLIDWFSNIDDILNNLVTEVADSQVSRYAYVMMKTQRIYTWKSTDGYASSQVSRRFETSIRERINPFGLATYNSTLSTTQAAILAALSISRSKV